MKDDAVTVFVCTSCGLQGDDSPSAGERLLSRLRAEAESRADVRISGVDCLAVCETPVVIAYSAPGKWSYVIGGADPARDVGDILAAARAVAASSHGIPAMADRPPFFRKGVISRIPPLPSAC